MSPFGQQSKEDAAASDMFIRFGSSIAATAARPHATRPTAVTSSVAMLSKKLFWG
jgi:hypothetical protein